MFIQILRKTNSFVGRKIVISTMGQHRPEIIMSALTRRRSLHVHRRMTKGPSVGQCASQGKVWTYIFTEFTAKVGMLYVENITIGLQEKQDVKRNALYVKKLRKGMQRKATIQTERFKCVFSAHYYSITRRRFSLHIMQAAYIVWINLKLTALYR